MLDYAEARSWIVMLRTFTVSDVADACAAPREEVETMVELARLFGIVEETGASANGWGPHEPILRWVPLPPGPRVHHTRTPPEVAVPMAEGGDPLRVPRGLPIRIVNDDRRAQSTPGVRHLMVLREKRYEAMEAARAAAKKRNAAKALKDPSWLKEKRKRQRQAARVRREATARKQAARSTTS